MDIKLQRDRSGITSGIFYNRVSVDPFSRWNLSIQFESNIMASLAHWKPIILRKEVRIINKGENFHKSTIKWPKWPK